MTLFYPVKKDLEDAMTNVTVASQVTSIIFTLHNTNRQKANKQKTNAMTKSESSDPKIHTMTKDLSITRASAEKAWVDACTAQGLTYKSFENKDLENWYGTMGPYLDFHRSYALRVQELRIGHSEMPDKKKGEAREMITVSKYGINGAHHILLEGVSYPPEVKSSMAQSVGPLTALLTMLRTSGQYRKKWENAVKRAFSHVSCIDDIIEVTRVTHTSSELSPLISLLADIALITTTRQATRMNFPLCMLTHAYQTAVGMGKGDEFLKFYSTSGPGGYLLYKDACSIQWQMEGNFKEEVAPQICFHGIFGTYKEDLGILGQITNTARWYQRKEIGEQFRGATNAGRKVKFNLPMLSYYSKLSSANQSGLLANVYTQLSSMPCFSGKREVAHLDEFYTHLSRRTIQQSGGKTIPQLISSLSVILQELIRELNDCKGEMTFGTTAWFSMSDLELDSSGTKTEFVARTTGRFFLGNK